MARGTVGIRGLRGGTIPEVTEFLEDMGRACFPLFTFEATLSYWGTRRYPSRFFLRSLALTFSTDSRGGAAMNRLRI